MTVKQSQMVIDNDVPQAVAFHPSVRVELKRRAAPQPCEAANAKEKHSSDQGHGQVDVPKKGPDARLQRSLSQGQQVGEHKNRKPVNSEIRMHGRTQNHRRPASHCDRSFPAHLPGGEVVGEDACSGGSERHIRPRFSRKRQETKRGKQRQQHQKLPVQPKTPKPHDRATAEQQEGCAYQAGQPKGERTGTEHFEQPVVQHHVNTRLPVVDFYHRLVDRAPGFSRGVVAGKAEVQELINPDRLANS